MSYFLRNLKCHTLIRVTVVSALVCWGPLSWQAGMAADALPVEEAPDESLVAASVRLSQQISLFDQQIASLESDYGAYDRNLIEPLQALVALQIAAGAFEEANRLLGRQLQLQSILDGPASFDQLPLLAELISNDIRRQQWQSVTERFEYIQWLHTQNPASDTASLLRAMGDTRAWHLASIYFDSPDNRINHFLSSREIQSDILRLAEEEYGEESEALVPWLYNFAVELYRAYAFLESKDELGADAKDYIARHEGRGQTYFLRQALSTVKRLRKIVEGMADPEAEAMAMIYEADFLMLRDNGNAAKLYRSAKLKLAEAGINEAQIEDFFSRPVVIPVEHYHHSLEQALAEQTGYGYTVQAGIEGADDSVHLGDFIALNESVPFARRPVLPALAAAASTELATTQLLFSINSRGTSSNAKAQESDPDTVRVRRDAIDAIESMHFRPKFVQRRWRRIEDVTINYLYPAEL
jgi:hypothetical protein